MPMVRSQEDYEQEALQNLFASHGWKIYEERLTQLESDMKDEAYPKPPVSDVALLNFNLGKAKGVLAALLLAEELKEVANPDADQA